MSDDALRKLDDAVTRLLSAVAWIVGWLLIALICAIMFDVVTRRFLVLASLAVQELEWHFHAALFTLSAGYAYVRNAHIRIDILRDRMGERRRAWIELLGVMFFLLPYVAVILYFSIGYAWGAFERLEGSRMPGGLPYRFIIKSALPASVLLLGIAGAAVAARCVLVLRGSRPNLDPASEGTA